MQVFRKRNTCSNTSRRQLFCARYSREINSMTRNQIIVAAIAIVVFVVIRNEREPDSHQVLKLKVNANMNGSKQKWFDRFHPVGTAKQITVHDFHDDQTPTGKKTTVRFTIYWEGPLTKNGFTKVQSVYDWESVRWVRAEILETNGVTNAQTAEGVGEFIGGALSEMLRE